MTTAGPTTAEPTTRARYTVRAYRDGAWWAIEIPAVEGGFSQARRLEQVEAMAREAVALLLDVAEDSFDLDLDITIPAEWAALAAEVAAARAAADTAETAAAARAREVARALRAAGLPVRDVGALLGVSAQRISQLVNS